MSKLKPWETHLRKLPSKAELKAKALEKKAAAKAYHAARYQFRVENRLCTTCGVRLPTDQTVRVCDEHRRATGKPRRSKYGY